MEILVPCCYQPNRFDLKMRDMKSNDKLLNCMTHDDIHIINFFWKLL